MAVLSLDDARILYARGWGGEASPSIRFRVELSDDGTLSVYKPGFFGETKVLFAALNLLVLRVWTETIGSGGGFIGGGAGVVGAAEGMLTAAVLNALTTSRREYALLGVLVFPGDGSQRDLVLGFPTLTESQLRAHLARAIPAWTENYVAVFLETLRTNRITEADARVTYAQLDEAEGRDLLTPEQIERMRAPLATILPPPQKRVSNESDRVAKLKVLADLLASGALTREEFESEKARVLSAN